MAVLRRNHYAYSKVDKEDLDEVLHRRAQFLIYKTLEKADLPRRPSILRIRFCRLKVRIGKRLKKLRKSMLVNINAARIALYKQILSQLKTFKLLFSTGGEKTIAALPPPLIQ